MVRYRNVSVVAKTFYGVTFNPGEAHNVPGFINDLKMIRVPYESDKLTQVNKKTPVPSTSKVDNHESIKEINKEEKSDGSDSNK